VLNTEIFHFGGGHPPPTPRNISAKKIWFIMVSPGLVEFKAERQTLKAV